MTKLIGLTGGIATGKSTVSTIIRQAGIPVIDADQVARQVQLPNTVGLTEIVNAFGQQVLLDNGELNRPALGKIVFNDQKARQKLNDIMQPLIRDEIWRQVAALKKQHLPAIILDAPLLFEQHYDEDCDQVIVVFTDREKQLQRLMARDHYSQDEALNRIKAQLSLADKEKKADILIDNNGDELQLQKQVASLINKLKNN
ncbi:dephospho-CoA kinase [Limosilactobacillus caccae]|uniref:dephospho-CoA kinase n=1 Tax=Limosilactobacillus caccae TaxID=1926284 RepID=UPI00097078DD|nr:dephospho-CoA kinase [Limosilactobacillus caccae]